jgi:hypothetical protein
MREKGPSESVRRARSGWRRLERAVRGVEEQAGLDGVLARRGRAGFRRERCRRARTAPGRRTRELGPC